MTLFKWRYEYLMNLVSIEHKVTRQFPIFYKLNYKNRDFQIIIIENQPQEIYLTNIGIHYIEQFFV